MNDKIVTFAALKSFYDAGQDLLGVFGNLVILVISGDEPSSILKVKAALLKKIDFDIPVDVLQTIVKRLKKNKLIDYADIKNRDFISIKLTESGKALEEKVRAGYENAKREKNAIIKSLKDHKLPYADDVLVREFDTFIETSTEEAVAILENETSKKNNAYTQVQQDIASFFARSEHDDPENFQRLKTFLYGRVISNAFLLKRFDTSAKIDNLSIYLDTNIIFSLMEFHEDSINSPVKEVISLVKESGATIKIFSFTADEIKNKLRGYLNEYGYYPTNIRVGSMYSTLKRKGVSKVDIMSLIEGFEEKLSKFGVEIDYAYNSNDLVIDRQEELSKLALYKPQSSQNSIKHDLAALLAVKSMRPRRASYLWEKNESIFLSADHQLTAYDFIECGHKESGTFPEVVFRSDMASLLWLKGQSGSDNVFLHNLFASHIREKIINANLWNKFVEELKKKRESGVFAQEDIENIISFTETEIILREKGESGIKEILNDDNIRRIKDLSTKKDNSIIENEKTIIAQSDQLMRINDALVESCKNFWNKVINISVWFVVFVLFCLFAYSLFEFGLSFVSNIFQCFIMLTVVYFAYSITAKKELRFLGSLIEYRNEIENKLISKCITVKKEKYQILSVAK